MSSGMSGAVDTRRIGGTVPVIQSRTDGPEARRNTGAGSANASGPAGRHAGSGGRSGRGRHRGRPSRPIRTP